MSTYHTSVLLQEVVEFLRIRPGKRYIDATLGGGGHTLAILEQGGLVLGVDTDNDALEFVRDELRSKSQELRIDEENVRLVRGNFREIDTIARENGFGRVSGVIFDLGVSSHQLDTPERGFSFRNIGPLDMRMDQSLEKSANDLIQRLSKQELIELFEMFGEERYARVIAERVEKVRQERSIETTEDLVKIIERAVPKRYFGKIHPATRVFQALRIAVNDEIRSLNEALPKAFSLLENGGRLLVISFHSLEDRIVKFFFANMVSEGKAKLVVKKPVAPTKEEEVRNPRSRSAKLRVLERII